MNQITDSLAPPPAGRAKPGNKAPQPSGDGAESTADPAAAPAVAPDQAPPAADRRQPGTARAFSEVMQADLGPVPTQPPPHRGAAEGVSAQGAQGRQALSPNPQPARFAEVSTAPTSVSDGPSRADSPVPTGAPGRAAQAEAPEDRRLMPATPPAARAATQAQNGVPVPDATAPAEPGRFAGAERPDTTDRNVPVAVQRARPDLAGTPLQQLQRGLPSEMDVTKHATLKAAARDFADQMTRGTARLAPAVPIQDVAVPRPTPPTAALIADPALPLGDSAADPALDPLSATLGSERQALPNAAARVMPAAAGALLITQPAVSPSAAPVSILAQITTQLSANGRSEMTLQLDPPELGLVRIGLTMGEGNVTAVITADRPDIDGMLRRHAAQLAAALEDAGYHGVDLSFDSGGSDTDGDAHDTPPPAPSFVRLAAADPAQPGGAERLLPRDGLDLRL